MTVNQLITIKKKRKRIEKTAIKNIYLLYTAKKNCFTSSYELGLFQI